MRVGFDGILSMMALSRVKMYWSSGSGVYEKGKLITNL